MNSGDKKPNQSRQPTAGPAALAIVDHLRRGFARFKLCAHFLQARSVCFNLLLLACDGRFLHIFKVVR